MIKTISKVGNSHMLIFDKELRDYLFTNKSLAHD